MTAPNSQAFTSLLDAVIGDPINPADKSFRAWIRDTGRDWEVVVRDFSNPAIEPQSKIVALIGLDQAPDIGVRGPAFSGQRSKEGQISISLHLGVELFVPLYLSAEVGYVMDHGADVALWIEDTLFEYALSSLDEGKSWGERETSYVTFFVDHLTPVDPNWVEDSINSAYGSVLISAHADQFLIKNNFAGSNFIFKGLNVSASLNDSEFSDYKRVV